MNNSILLQRLGLMLALLHFSLTPQPILALEKGQYPAPALEGFQAAGESPADVDTDGVNETVIRRYVSESGDSVFSLVTNDRVWAWSLATVVGDKLDPARSYVIRDSNCDGIFDEKYGQQEEFQIPPCVK